MDESTSHAPVCLALMRASFACGWPAPHVRLLLRLRKVSPLLGVLGFCRGGGGTPQGVACAVCIFRGGWVPSRNSLCTILPSISMGDSFLVIPGLEGQVTSPLLSAQGEAYDVRRDPKVLRRVSRILNKEGLHFANLFYIFE